MTPNFQKEPLVLCGRYKFEITVDVRSSSKVPSSTRSPIKMTLCGSEEVWALESPVMSIEEVVKTETIESFIIVHVLPCLQCPWFRKLHRDSVVSCSGPHTCLGIWLPPQIMWKQKSAWTYWNLPSASRWSGSLSDDKEVGHCKCSSMQLVING